MTHETKLRYFTVAPHLTVIKLANAFMNKIFSCASHNWWAEVVISLVQTTLCFSLLVILPVTEKAKEG